MTCEHLTTSMWPSQGCLRLACPPILRVDRRLPLLPGSPPPRQPRKASAIGLEFILGTSWPPLETTTEVVWGKELVWPVVRSPQTSALLWGSHSRLATILTCQGKVRPPGPQAGLTSVLEEALGRHSSPPVTWMDFGPLTWSPGQPPSAQPCHGSDRRVASSWRGNPRMATLWAQGRGPGPVTPVPVLLLTQA